MLRVLLFFLGISQGFSGCVINLDEVNGEDPPLLLEAGEFLLPSAELENGTRIISMGEGSVLELYCHGSEKYQDTTVLNLNGESSISAKLTCSSGKFYSGENLVSVESVSCSRRQEPRLVRTREQCSPVGADGRQENLEDLWTVQIGWQIHDTFKEQIRLCVDELVFATIWTKHTISSKIEMRDVDSGRPSFRSDTTRFRRFFPWTTSTGLNRMYSKASQAAQVTALLGSNTMNASPLIETSRSGTHYFAKGHLAPDAAFMYNIFQDATYYFINVAPQFQSFNNGNWKILEGNARELATKSGTDIVDITGTHGVLAYTDANNNPTDIYLNTDQGQYVPAPLYYWKVLYDPSTEAGVAIIGMNDPYVSEAPETLCTDRCSELAWVDWDIKELDAGLMYCCSVEEARKSITSIPQLKTSGLLGKSEETTEEPPIDVPFNGCEVNLEKLTGKYPPLLLQNSQFIYPKSINNNEERILSIENGEELELFCHGSEKYQQKTKLSVSGLTGVTSTVLTCTAGGLYSGETKVDVEAATCNRRQEPRLVRSNEVCSSMGADGRTTELEDLWKVQIGWKVGDSFIEQIGVCVDEKLFATIWTNHTISSSIALRDKDPGRPGFRIDNSRLKRFFKWTTSTGMNRLYSKASQARTVTSLLGSNKLNNEAVIETSSSGTHYFAKGHLAPDASFVYNVQQDSTYYFINVAPQFQSFNNGNWKALEGAARDIAEKSGRDMRDYTGTHGLLSYPATAGDETDIYLKSTATKKFVPAPLYYWKVLVDSQTGAGIAIIGLNDPHAKAAPKLLCPNRCSELSWVDWDISELDGGYMYCCDVSEARKAIPSIPLMQTSGLLHL